MTAMMPFPLRGGEWETFANTTEDESVVSLHHVPVEQFVHTAEDSGTCMCGPSVTLGIMSGDLVELTRHVALDKSFYEHTCGDYCD